MNEYEITFMNGDKSTYKASNISEALKKVIFWDDIENVTDIKKVIRLPKYGPSREGSSACESGSIASGGTKEYCTCSYCF